MRTGGRVSAGLAAAFALMGGAAEAAKAPARPDLAVKSVERPPDRLLPGTSFLVATTVQNKGAKRAAATTVAFFLSRDATRSKDDPALGTATVLALRPRTSRLTPATVRIPAGQAAGAFRLIGCIDPGARQKESNEKNNCVTGPGSLTVQAPPAPTSGAGGTATPVAPPTAPEQPAPAAPGTVADPGAAVPILLSTAPGSPGTSRQVTVTGRAEAGRLVQLLLGSCATQSVAEQVAADDGSFAIATTVPANAETLFLARARGGPSASTCSAALRYRHDDRVDVAQRPVFRPGGGADLQPAVEGRVEGGAAVQVFTARGTTAPACTGDPAAGLISDGTPFSARVPVAPDAVTSASVLVTDVAGNTTCLTGDVSLRYANALPVAAPTFSTFGTLTNGPPIDAQGIATTGDVVRLFATANCSGEVVSSYEVVSSSGLWELEIAPPTNATTPYSVRAVRPSTSARSACTGPVTLTHDDRIADLVITRAPDRGVSRTVEVHGTGDPRVGIRAYVTADCSGEQTASGFSNPDGSWWVPVEVPAESTTSLSFRAVDSAGNESACAGPRVYRHRPVVTTPSQLSTNPHGPSDDATPMVQGVADETADVRVYADDECAGPVLATTSVTRTDGGWSVEAPVTPNAGTALRARATNPRTGDVSGCSGFTFYRHDDQPTRPVLTRTTPASPSAETQTVVRYTADELGTLTWFRSADCSGTGTDRVNGVTNNEGFLLEVETETSTTVSAIFTDRAGNVSTCSNPLTYVSSVPPAAPGDVRLLSPNPTTSRTYDLRGSGPAGATLITYADAPGAAPCSTELRRSLVGTGGSWVSSDPLPANQTTVLRVRTAKPTFGTQSVCVTGPTVVHDDQAPAPPAITAIAPDSGEVRPTVSGTGEPGASIQLRSADCTQIFPGGVTVAADGTWSSQTMLPPEEVVQIAARQFDLVGQPSPCGDPRHYSTITSVHEREPNGTVGAAAARATEGLRATNADTVFRGQARAGDTDVFAVDVVGRDRTLHLETSGDDPYRCGDRQTRLRLLDDAGAPLATDTDSGDGLCSRIVRHGVGAGRYYVEVRGDADGRVDVDPYHLLVDLGRSDEVPELDGGQLRNGTIEQADERAAADGVRLLGEGVLSGRMPKFFQDDVDVVRLEVPTASAYRVETFRGDGFGCNAVAPGAAVVDASGTNVMFATTELGIEGCRGALGDLAAGTHHVRVFSSTPDSGTWRTEVEAIGDGGAEAEPNDTAAAAGTLVNGQAVRGAIAPGAFDLWRITVPAGGRTVRLDVFNGVPVNGRCGAAGQLDSTLTLSRSDGTVLVTDDDDGEGLCSRIDGTGATPLDPPAAALPAGQYVVRVGTDATSLTGTFNYRLTVAMR